MSKELEEFFNQVYILLNHEYDWQNDKNAQVKQYAKVDRMLKELKGKQTPPNIDGSFAEWASQNGWVYDSTNKEWRILSEYGVVINHRTTVALISEYQNTIKTNQPNE